MAVPKRRTSHAKQGMRRSHHAIKPMQVSYCNNCGEQVLTHRVCSNCGYLNSQKREVVSVEQTKEE